MFWEDISKWQNENARISSNRITEIKRAVYAGVIRRVDPSSEVDEDTNAPRNLATGGIKGSIRYALQKINPELDISEDTIRKYYANQEQEKEQEIEQEIEQELPSLREDVLVNTNATQPQHQQYLTALMKQ